MPSKFNPPNLIASEFFETKPATPNSSTIPSTFFTMPADLPINNFLDNKPAPTLIDVSMILSETPGELNTLFKEFFTILIGFRLS